MRTVKQLMKYVIRLAGNCGKLPIGVRILSDFNALSYVI